MRGCRSVVIALGLLGLCPGSVVLAQNAVVPKRPVEAPGSAPNQPVVPKRPAPSVVKVAEPRFPARLLGQFQFASRRTIHGALFVPRSSLIAAVDDQATLAVWNVAEGTLKTFFPPDIRQGLSGLAVSPDGRMLALASGRFVFLLDSDTLAERRTIEAPEEEWTFQLATFSPDGRRILATGHKTPACLFDVDTGQLLVKQPVEVDYARTLAFSNAGTAGLLCGQGVGKPLPSTHALRWNLKTGEVDFRVRAPRVSVIHGIRELPDGRIAGLMDQQLVTWDAKTGAELKRTHLATGYITDISRDGRRMAVAANDGRVYPIELAALNARREMFETELTPTTLALSAEGDRVLIGSRHGFVQLWTLRFPKVDDAEPGLVSALAPENEDFTPPSLWPRVSPPDANGVRQFDGHRGTILSMALLPDEKNLVTAGFDQRVLVWDLTLGRLAQKHDPATGGNGHGGARNLFFAMAAVPRTGRLLMAGGQYKGTESLSLWNAETLKSERELKGLKDTCRSVAVSSDGKLCAAAGHRQDAVVWDIASGEEKLRIPVETNQNGLGFFCVEFSGDARHLLVSHGETLSVWSLETRQMVKQSQLGQVQIIRARPHAREVVVDTGRSSMFLTVPELNQVESFATGGHFRHAEFSADGMRLAIAGADGLVVIDVPKNELILQRKDNRLQSSCLAFSADGKLAVVSEENTFFTIPVP